MPIPTYNATDFSVSFVKSPMDIPPRRPKKSPYYIASTFKHSNVKDAPTWVLRKSTQTVQETQLHKLDDGSQTSKNSVRARASKKAASLFSGEQSSYESDSTHIPFDWSLGSIDTEDDEIRQDEVKVDEVKEGQRVSSKSSNHCISLSLLSPRSYVHGLSFATTILTRFFV